MISELQITACQHDDDTYLKRSYFTSPFKVADISGALRSLHLVMMSSSPGILDGDQYEISLELAARTSVHLYTQAYQRIFTMQGGAKQQVRVTMGAGSSLYYLPHPSVPHENSSFEAYSRIDISSDCKLLWGEIITCGRKQNGEVFKYRLFQSILEVYKDERLVFKDVTMLEPLLLPADVTGQLEQYTHQAALYWHGEHVGADIVHTMLSGEKDITVGVSQTASGALLIRILGMSGEQLYRLFKKIVEMAGEERLL